MNKKLIAAALAVALSFTLTACGDDDEDCNSAGIPGVTTMSMVDGRSGGTSGGGSRSGSSGSKSSGKSKGSTSGGASSGSKGKQSGKSKTGGKVKIDDDLFEDC